MSNKRMKKCSVLLIASDYQSTAKSALHSFLADDVILTLGHSIHITEGRSQQLRRSNVICTEIRITLVFPLFYFQGFRKPEFPKWEKSIKTRN
jgi:hypothetical protein